MLGFKTWATTTTWLILLHLISSKHCFVLNGIKLTPFIYQRKICQMSKLSITCCLLFPQGKKKMLCGKRVCSSSHSQFQKYFPSFSLSMQRTLYTAPEWQQESPKGKHSFSRAFMLSEQASKQKASGDLCYHETLLICTP